MVDHLIPVLSPYFPAGVSVMPSGLDTKSFRLERISAKHVAGDLASQSRNQMPGLTVFVTGLGAWVPLLPQRLRARLVAEHAAETILSTAFAEEINGPYDDDDLQVHAELRPDGVWFMLELPTSAAVRPTEPVGPIALDLLGPR